MHTPVSASPHTLELADEGKLKEGRECLTKAKASIMASNAPPHNLPLKNI